MSWNDKYNAFANVIAEFLKIATDRPHTPHTGRDKV